MKRVYLSSLAVLMSLASCDKTEDTDKMSRNENQIYLSATLDNTALTRAQHSDEPMLGDYLVRVTNNADNNLTTHVSVMGGSTPKGL